VTITRAAAVEAAIVYKDTQPKVDEVKATIAANKAAKDTLGAYMIEQGVDVFRDVLLTVDYFEGFDQTRMVAYLGEKANRFKVTRTRKHFGLRQHASK